MISNLLDVNVLIALVRDDHVDHAKVKRWFQQPGARPWATCSLTETGFVRIVSNPKFSEHPLSIDEAMEMLGILTRLPKHQFWSMDMSFLDAVAPFSGRLFGHQQVTDACLLGLAMARKGRLVTLDRAIKVLAGAEFAEAVALL